MIDEGLVASAPEEVARLLYNCVRVDKVAKGDFLGEPYLFPLTPPLFFGSANEGFFFYIRDDFNMQVLAAFSGLFNFHGLDFDIALRRFLYSFRLPGICIHPLPPPVVTKYLTSHTSHRRGTKDRQDNECLCHAVLF